MKARVKATGEIVEINESSTIYDARLCHIYNASELENIPDIESDYWDKLLHQYAGLAMQGILTQEGALEASAKDVAFDAILYATALVEKLKGKEEMK